MPIARPHTPSYALAKSIFVLSVTVCKMFTFEMCINLTLTYKWAKFKYKYAIERRHATFYLLAIAIFAIIATVAIYVHDPKLTLTFRMAQGQT